MTNILKDHSQKTIDSLKELVRLNELRLSVIDRKLSTVDENLIAESFKKIGVELIGTPSQSFRDVKSYTGILMNAEEVIKQSGLKAANVKWYFNKLKLS